MESRAWHHDLDSFNEFRASGVDWLERQRKGREGHANWARRYGLNLFAREAGISV